MSIVLLTTILIPVIPLVFPFIRSSLKNSHIITLSFGICNNNSILQKSRSSNIICRRNNSMNRRLCNSLQILSKTIKSLCSSCHTDYNRHRRKLILFRTAKELLHYCCCSRKICCLLRTSMSLIDNKVKTVRLLAYSIRKSFQNCMLSHIGTTSEITILTELLSIKEIDMSVLENLLIKCFIGNSYTSTETLFSLSFHLDSRLLIKLRRIG